MHTALRFTLGLLFLAATTPAFAQIGNVGGVYVDPEGMLRDATSLSREEQRKLLQTAPLTGSTSTQHESPARKLSLRALEQLVAEHQQKGEPLPADVQLLAGLQAVTAVVFEGDDVILIGPASAWSESESGDLIGRSGRPVLRLEDLIVALRFAFDPQNGGFLGCSIDPTPAGMRAYDQHVRSLNRIDRTRLPEIARGMERAMGPQDVRIFGTSGDSRLALALVSADYRLKRLSMGHDPAPTRKFQSYLDLAAKMASGSGRVQQHRFWFVAKYDAIRRSEDERAWSFEGTGVAVATAPRSEADQPKPTRAATAYVEAFTRDFPEIAKAVPVLGELQNVINLATVAGVIHRRASQPEGWKPEHFLDDAACPMPRATPPKQVPSLANVRLIRERSWMFSVSGGVEFQLADVLDPNSLKPGDDSLMKVRAAVKRDADESWWWE